MDEDPAPVALDHVFVMAPRGGRPLTDALSDLGLVETYRRKHDGQGTANICYAFDNAFLEVLWVEDLDQVRSRAVERCRLDQRAQGDHPIGIAWRGRLDGVATWSFRPPYLPVDTNGIQVAEDSDRAGVPLLFTFPGSTAPADWPAVRRGDLQRDAGFDRLVIEALHLRVDPGEGVEALARHGVLEQVHVGEPGVTVRLEGPDRAERITLPCSMPPIESAR